MRSHLQSLHIAHHRIQNGRLPAVALPLELLAYIFELACQKPAKPVAALLNSYAHVVRHMRSAISATCYSWRQAVLATPAVWSDIHMGSLTIVPYDSAPIHRRYMPTPKLIPLELARAREHLLAFHVRFDASKISSMAYLQECITPIVSAELHRTAILDVYAIRSLHSLQILSKPQDLHNLRYLWLIWKQTDPGGELECIDITHARHLQLLSLRRFSRPGRRLQPLRVKCLDSCHIKELCFGGEIDPTDALRTIVSCASNLTKLDWINRHFDGVEALNSPRSNLSTLLAHFRSL